MKNIILFSFMLLFICCNKKKQTSDYIYISFLKESDSLRASGNYDNLIDLNKSHLKTAKENGKKDEEALCYINIAYISTTMGNYKHALFFFKEAEKILKNSNSKVVKAIFYERYASLNSILRLHSNAYNNLNQSFKYIRKSKNREFIKYFLPTLYLSKATNFDWLKKPDSALIYFHKSKLLNNKALTECLIGEHHFMKNKLDSAFLYTNRALRLINNKNTQPSERFYILFSAGNIYTARGQYIEADYFYKKALKQNKKMNHIFDFFNPYIYQALASLYEKQGKKNDEQFYRNKYIVEKDKLENDQYEVMNITVKNLIANIKTDNKQQKNNISFVLVLLLSVILIGLILYNKQAKILKDTKEDTIIKTKELNKKINDKNFEEIVSLAKKNDSTFLAKFQEYYPNFINELQKIHPDLEQSELVFCALLKLNFSSKEISKYTFVQIRSVHQRKYRLRKKLNISTETDIYIFFNNL